MVECKDRFGFSNGAWDRARLRGELATRSRGGWNRRSETRAQVERLLNEGLRNSEVAQILEIATATVSYHARRLGVPADERFSRRVDWPEVQIAHDQGLSVRECARKFGFHTGSWYGAVQRGDIVPRSHLIPIADLLVVGRTTSRSHLKRRLVREGLKEDLCEECGISEWQGKPLSVQLHNKNGDGTDNRLENIALLCPNCHSQTETWGGRNRRSRLKLVDPPRSEDEEAA